MKRNKVNKAVKAVQDLVDELTRPDNMIDGRIACRKDEKEAEAET